MIYTTYTGSDESLRNNAAFQLSCAKADLDLAFHIARYGNRIRSTRARESIPAIKARIAAWTARLPAEVTL
jgi:hypothetical protein